MKNFSVVVRVILAITAIALVTGCAGQMKRLPGKIVHNGALVDAYVSQVTVGQFDRSTSAIQISVDTGITDEEGELVLEQIGLETETGNTGVRDMAVATVPTLLGTIVQGEYLKKAAKINAGVCGNGGCGGSGTSIVNQVVSESVANSATNAITEVMVGCPTGDCAGAGR